MARVEVTFVMVGGRTREGGSFDGAVAAGLTTEVLDVAGTSVATSTASPHPGTSGCVCVWAAIDVWVVAGSDPVAAVPAVGTVGEGMRVPAGTTLPLSVKPGDRVAVIAA